MRGVKVFSLRLSDELAALVEEARGEIPLSAFVRGAVEQRVARRLAETYGSRERAVEQALSEAKGPLRREQASPGPVPPSGGVRLAAPAESSMLPRARGETFDDALPVGHPARSPVRGSSSSFAKRDVRPVPKPGRKAEQALEGGPAGAASGVHVSALAPAEPPRVATPVSSGRGGRSPVSRVHSETCVCAVCRS